MISVRVASAPDAPVIEKIHRVSLPSPWSLDSISSWLKDETWLWLVAEIEGVSVGFLSARFLADTVELLNIAVLKTYRRRGVGRALLEALCARVAKDPRVKRILLEVRYHNLEARRLYVKLGFRLLFARERYYPDTGEAMWQMVKDSWT